MAELCLLFDSDGTLVDSEILLAEAMSSTLPRYGLPFTSDRYMNEFRGMRFMSIVRTLEAVHGVLEEAPTRRMEGEMRALLEQLEQADNPHTCPHGRPTMIHISSYHMDREFGRR